MDKEEQHIIHEDCEVVHNELYAGNRFLMTVKAPYITELTKPGHSIYLRIPGMEGRAVKTHFPIFDVDEAQGTLGVLYYVIGYATACMVRVQCGHKLYAEGPLDTPWPFDGGAKRVLLYGNEMGPARLCLLAKKLCEAGVEVDFAAEGATLGSVAAFQRHIEPMGAHVVAITKDGLGDTFGELGRRSYLATILSEHTYDYMVVCGSQDIIDEYRVIAFVADLPYYSALDLWNPVSR